MRIASVLSEAREARSDGQDGLRGNAQSEVCIGSSIPARVPVGVSLHVRDNDTKHSTAMSQESFDANTLCLARAAVEWREGVGRVAQRILGCPDAAHDAVQEALITLWLQPPGHSQGRRWLQRAVVHRSLHERRSRQRRSRWEEAAGDALAWSYPTFDPERDLERSELAGILRQALCTLPEPLRSCFVLRELEGWGYEQISGELQIPLGTVRSRLSRAKAAMRAQLSLLLSEPRELDDGSLKG